LPFIVASCVTPKRYARFTKEKITELSQRTVAAPLPDYLFITTDSISSRDNAVNVQKRKLLFIPAILYWYLDCQLECKIAGRIPAGFFEEDIIRLADSVKLEEN